MAAIDNTFAKYLQDRGFDMTEANRKYMATLKDNPASIFTYYAQTYPDEYRVWKTQRRILGDDAA